MLDFLVSNDLLATIFAFAIVFIPAVIVHELGHFLAARAVGITVLEFGVGFPPRVARLFTWRETEFTLNVLPFGGFVRPLGEDMIRPVGEEATQRDREKLQASRQSGQESKSEGSPVSNEREELAARGFHNTMAVHEAKPWPRIFFMAAGAIANFIFAFLVFVFIGLIGVPQEVGVRVGFALVPEDSSLATAGFEQGDVIEQINGEYFVTANELFERLQRSMGQPVTVTVRRTAEDPLALFDIQFVPTEEMISLLNSPDNFVLVTGVEPGSPGHLGGLQPLDIITAFNGVSLAGAENPAQSLIERTDASAGREAVLTVIRNGESLEIALTPRENPPPGSGKIGIEISTQFVNADRTFSYGVARKFVDVRQPIGPSIQYGIDRVGTIFGLIAEFPSRLLGGDTAPEERRVVSVVGISAIGGNILQDSVENNRATAMLEYVALISIALGFTNLLPIPALDGGRILFVVLELIRGKPIPPEREGLVHLVGIIFILSLGIFVIINDLVNPLTDSFLR